jgi:hypothetical protein
MEFLDGQTLKQRMGRLFSTHADCGYAVSSVFRPLRSKSPAQSQ